MLENAHFAPAPHVYLSGAVRLVLSGAGGGSWLVDFDHRRVTETAEDAACSATLSASDYVAFARGETAFDALFLQGKVVFSARPPGDKPLLPPELSDDLSSRQPAGCVAPALSLGTRSRAH